MRRTYLDHASTTPPRPEAVAAVLSWLATPAAHPRDVRSELLVKLALLDRAAAAPRTLAESKLSGHIAIVLGSEGDGLRRLTRERCDFLARIPMAGQVSSLNVSVAAGVALFEAQRQRLTGITQTGS